MTRRLGIALSLQLAAVGGVCCDAVADNLSCLYSLRGKHVIWDSEWQSDRKDNGVEYQVDSVSDSTGPGNQQQVTVELTARGKAEQPHRTAHVIREHVAQLLCAKVVYTDQQHQLKSSQERAESQAKFRKEHAKAIDSLLNGPRDAKRGELRDRYLAAFEGGDFDQAERILSEAGQAAAPTLPTAPKPPSNPAVHEPKTP